MRSFDSGPPHQRVQGVSGKARFARGTTHITGMPREERTHVPGLELRDHPILGVTKGAAGHPGHVPVGKQLRRPENAPPRWESS